MPHYIYIIKSLKDQKYYIGESSDVEARVSFHNAGRQRSTRNRIPFVLVYTEEVSSRAEVLAREKQIKSWKGGAAFRKLITGM